MNASNFPGENVVICQPSGHSRPGEQYAPVPYAPVICWPRSRSAAESKRPATGTASGDDYNGDAMLTSQFLSEHHSLSFSRWPVTRDQND
jgi:hypothetical protein